MLLEIDQSHSGFSSRHEIGRLVPDDRFHSTGSENQTRAGSRVSDLQPTARASGNYGQVFTSRELHHFTCLLSRSGRHFQRALGAEMITRCQGWIQVGESPDTFSPRSEEHTSELQ